MKQIKRFLSFAVIMIVAMAALTACGKSKDAKSIDCKDFVNVSIKGFEGSGFAKFEMNPEFAQDRDYMDKMFPDLIRMDAEKELTKIYNQLKFKTEPENGFKNGDTITVTVDSTGATLLAEHGLTLKNDTFTVKIEGLEEGTAFDPFEGVEVVFSGYNGNGDFRIKTENASETAKKYGGFEDQNDYALFQGL